MNKNKIELPDNLKEIKEINTNVLYSDGELLIKEMGKTKQLKQKIERLHSIIKEAREYIEEDIKGNYFKRYDDEVYKLCDELLEILDKVEEN